MIANECAKVAAKIRARHSGCTDCRNTNITTEDVIEVMYAWRSEGLKCGRDVSFWYNCR